MRNSVIGRSLHHLLLVPALLLVVLINSAAAEVSLSINIGPPIVVAEPPAVVLVPGSRVYFVPDFGVDIFFYGGYWWSPRGDRWYRSRDYDGPWRVVSRSVVPRPVYRVPGDYRKVYAGERHIPYGQWKKERGYGSGKKGEYRGRDDHKRRDDDHRGRDRGRDDHGRGGHGRGHD